MAHKVERRPGCTNTARLVGYMLLCIDGLWGSRVVEESPVQQSFRHDYEITGSVKRNGNIFGDSLKEMGIFLAKLAIISFS